MPYTTVDVEVYLDDFDDQDLIDELEARGWFVGPDRDWQPLSEELTEYEIAAIVGAFQDCRPGTIGNDIYEKLRKR